MPSNDQAPLPRPDPNTYWILPGRLLAGEYPGSRALETTRDRLGRFLDAGVRHFVDLTEPNELAPYDTILAQEANSRRLHVTHRRFPIPNDSVPSSPQVVVNALSAIEEGIATGGGVYVHCWGGIGRTGLVVACWLQEYGRDARDALDELAERWQTVEKHHRKPNSPETPEQFEWVRNWPRLRTDVIGLRAEDAANAELPKEQTFQPFQHDTEQPTMHQTMRQGPLIKRALAALARAPRKAAQATREGIKRALGH
jgi:hypothetical protein